MKVAAFYENIKTGAEYRGITIEKAIEELMNEGLDLLYFGMTPADQNLNDIKAIVRGTGIGIEGIHAWIDFAHDPMNNSYEQILSEAADLKVNNVLLVPGMMEDNDDHEKVVKNIIEGISNAVKFGEKLGVPVSMEDFDGLKSPYSTIGGLSEFMNSVPGLRCSFDTGNFIMQHENELSAYELFKDKICTLHLKDRCKEPSYPDSMGKVCADGSLEYVAPVGQGYIHIKDILLDLKEAGYSGNAIVELYDYSPSHMLEGITESIKWVKNIVG